MEYSREERFLRILAVDAEASALRSTLEAIRETAPWAEAVGFSNAQAVPEAERSWDVAFLDVARSGEQGIALARRLKAHNPEINIIFAAGDADYRDAAFELHASGYLRKPITPEKVHRELKDLRYPVTGRARLYVRCFGAFEVLLDGVPLRFKYERTRELLAYLVDRWGALCTNGEVLAVLFEDDADHEAYLRSLKKDLLDTLSAGGCRQVIVRQRGKMGICPEEIQCDYYDWRNGIATESPYAGEYMRQYPWAEFTNENLMRSL